MNASSLSRWTIAVAAIAAATLACGVDQNGSDPTLGSYEEPLTSTAAGAQPTCGNPKKVLICHIPPGNPANAHSICVGSPAQPAHLAHGDVLGACANGGGSGGDESGGDDGGIEEGGGGGDVDAGSGGGTDADAGSPTSDDAGVIL